MMEKFMQIVAASLQGSASNKDMTPEELAQRAIAIALHVGSHMADIDDETE